MPWLIEVNLLLIGVTLIFIMWQDIACRIISHSSLIVLAIFLLFDMLLRNRSPEILQAAVTLATGFIMFAANMWGGGDAKLLTLLSVSLPKHLFMHYLLLTVFIGGLMAIIGLIFFRQNIRAHGLPYGMALSLAFMLINPLQ